MHKRGGWQCAASCACYCPAATLPSPHLTTPSCPGINPPQADIFVAVHGANQANTWLMRPGGAMIEIQPWGFDHGPAHTQYPLFAHDDAETKVQWWMISVCDPALSTPGVHERRGAHEPVGWAKNRNLRIG